jgi:hypothetical protein
MTDETKNALAVLERMRDGRLSEIAAVPEFAPPALMQEHQALAHAITVIRDTDEMLADADGIEFEGGATIRRGLLKWRFVARPIVGQPSDHQMFDSPTDAYKALKDEAAK